MNKDLAKLHPYPFEKLSVLKQGLTPPPNLDHISLSIGEPRHAAPHFVVESLIAHLHQLSSYPSSKGVPELREAISKWLCRRFNIAESEINPEHNILPVNGTREALFAIAQCIVDASKPAPLVMMPNPFYQIYEGAALLAGAQPHYMDCIEANDYLPDLEAIDDKQWSRCQLLYICSPGNPTGAVMSEEYLQRLVALSQQHDFVIASDECYSEIYFDEDRPPPGLLGAASAMGLGNFHNCLVFHSLSKRSNLPAGRHCG